MMEASNNFSLSDCHYCGGDFFYDEPPPILFIPPPPIHPDCNGYELFYGDAEQAKSTNDIINQSLPLLLGFVVVAGLLLVYLLFTRRSRIISSLTRSRLSKANNQPLNNITLNKNQSLHNSMSNSGLHITDPCFLQTNGDKNLISPIISEHASHQKTSIPSNCWAQPNSIIVRTIRRVPNEYEAPSSTISRTVYADISDDQRFYSPYNMHTYAEVREAQVLL